MLTMVRFAALAACFALIAVVPAIADVEQDQERIALAWVEAHNANDPAVVAELRAKLAAQETKEKSLVSEIAYLAAERNNLVTRYKK